MEGLIATRIDVIGGEHYYVRENVEEVTDTINEALRSGTTFVWFTGAKDGFEFSVKPTLVESMKRVELARDYYGRFR